MKAYTWLIRTAILGSMLAGYVIPASAQTDNSTPTNGAVPAPPAGGTPQWHANNQYWKDQFFTRPYNNGEDSYSTYQAAYQFGFDAYEQYGGKPYDELNKVQLQHDWQHKQTPSILNWGQAQAAVHDAYQHRYDLDHSATPPIITPSTNSK